MKITPLVLIMVLLLISSCKTTKLPPSITETKTIIDSIIVERQTIDTLVVTRQPDTVFIHVPIAQLTPTPIMRKSNHATLTLQLTDSVLKAECVTDSLTSIIEQQKETITKLRTTTTVKEQTHIIKERYIPTLLKPLMWIGGLVVAVIFGGIAIRLLKPKLF